jgi:hypothetical protein
MVVWITKAGRAVAAEMLQDHVAGSSRILQSAEHGTMRSGALLPTRAPVSASTGGIHLHIRKPE